MPEGLFEEAKGNTSEADPLAQKIEELQKLPVGDLAKGKAYADQFIDFLEEQNEGLKEELSKRLNAEKLLEEMKKSREIVAEPQKEADASGFEAEDLNALIEQKINTVNQKKVFERNVLEVDAKVKEIYGEKSKDFIAQKATELGLGLSYLGDVAARSPSAFYNLIGLDVKRTVSSGDVSKGTINSESLDKNVSLVDGTWNSYKELRKKDPARFFSTEVQRKMFADRKTKGDAFYN